MQRRRSAIMPLALLVAAACSGGGDAAPVTGVPTTPAGSTATAITVADNRFTPAATTVPAGTTITWSWTGAASHNVTFDDGARSATQQSGSYQRSFATAGAYPYHCTIHGAAMSGTVTVQ